MFLPLMVSLLLGQAPATPKPAWIETLPEAPGRLYALGSAELGAQEGQALARAAAKARLEVVSRLRVTVKGQTQVATVTTELRRDGSQVSASGERQARDTVSVSAQAEDLPGLVVERTYADPQGRSAYALAYLDLTQAEQTLASRLARLQEGRSRVGPELTRQARWRLRGLKGDLDRLADTVELLALTGAAQALGSQLQAERLLLEGRLAALEQAELPPLALAKLSVGLRSNLELSPAVAAYLEAQLAASGLSYREQGPDLTLELTFAGGAKGPEFIFVDMDVYQGLSYRLEAQLRLLDEGGTPVGRPVPIQIIQSSSPDGMVNEFRKQFDRRLPRLLAALRSALQ